MANPDVCWISPFAPDECAARLSAAIDVEGRVMVSMRSLFGSKEVIGHVTASSIRLRRRIAYRNSFQSFLFARMEPALRGTRIVGAVKMHPFVRAFMFVWFGFLVLFSTLLLVAAMASAFDPGEARARELWLVLLVPGVMGAFGFGLVRLGRFLAREEEAFLLAFLERTLDARRDEARF